MQSLPIPFAVAHGHLHILAGEVASVHGSGESQVYLGMALCKFSQPMDQPLGGKIRRRADRQGARTLPLDEAFGCDGNAIECVANLDEVRATGLRDDEALVLAIE